MTLESLNCGESIGGKYVSKDTRYNIQISDNCIVRGNHVIINGVELPPVPSKGYNSTVVNGKVYIDGYEFKNGKWKRTLIALWHLWF